MPTIPSLPAEVDYLIRRWLPTWIGFAPEGRPHADALRALPEGFSAEVAEPTVRLAAQMAAVAAAAIDAEVAGASSVAARAARTMRGDAIDIAAASLDACEIPAGDLVDLVRRAADDAAFAGAWSAADRTLGRGLYLGRAWRGREAMDAVARSLEQPDRLTA